MSNTTPAAGWYPDPEGSPQQRFWNGSEWTDQYHSPTPPPQSWWQANKNGIIVAGAVILGIAGLGVLGNMDSQPTATPKPAVTVTQQAPAPAETFDDPVEELSDDDIADLSMDIAWDGMSASAQEDICLAYALYPDEAWDAFDSASGYQFTRSQFNDFFDGVC